MPQRACGACQEPPFTTSPKMSGIDGLGFGATPGPLASCCPKTKARAFVEESGAGLGVPFFGRLVGLKDPDFLRRV